MLKNINRKYVIAAIIFLALFIVHFFARYFYIDGVGVWYDESFSIFHSQASLGHIKATCKWDINPPGYLMALHFWIKLFGISEPAVRSFSLVSVSLAGASLFFISKKYLNLQTAIFATIFLLVSNELFYYSLEARGYGFIFLMVVISFGLIFRFLEKQNWKLPVILGLLYGWMIYTHYLLLFLVFIQMAFLVIHKPKLWKKLLLVLPGIVLILFHWRKRIFEIFLRKTGENAHKTWIPEPTTKHLYSTFVKLFNNEVTLWICVVVIVLGLIFLIKQKSIKQTYIYIIFLFLSSFVVVFMHYYISKITPVWVIRYFLYSLIGFTLLLSFIISILKIPNWVKYTLVSGIALMAFVPTKYTYGPRMNYREGIAFIKDSLETRNTHFIVQTIDVGHLFTYYHNKNVFKDPVMFNRIANENHIYLMNDTNGICKYRIDTVQHLIHTKTFGPALPDAIENYLDSLFVHKKVYTQFNGFRITDYHK